MREPRALLVARALRDPGALRVPEALGVLEALGVPSILRVHRLGPAEHLPGDVDLERFRGGGSRQGVQQVGGGDGIVVVLRLERRLVAVGQGVTALSAELVGERQRRVVEQRVELWGGGGTGEREKDWECEKRRE